jgi:hypothetical protein
MLLRVLSSKAAGSGFIKPVLSLIGVFNGLFGGLKAFEGF